MVGMSSTNLLINMHHAHVRFYKQSLDPTASIPHDTDDAWNAFEGSIAQLQAQMPQLVFVNGFWRQLIDFADSDQLGALVGGAATSGPDQSRRMFFEGVVEACSILQSIPPAPRTPRQFADFWPWAPPLQHEQGIVVGNRVVANIVFSHSHGRITVHSIRHV
jgi:hypothetical protein